MTVKTHDCKHGLEPECGRLCSHDNITYLITRLELIEGSILERLEKEKYMAIRELMEALEWEPCVVTMAVGSLMRQGMIRCSEYGKDVFLEFLEQRK